MLSAYGGGDEPVCMGALALHFILSRDGSRAVTFGHNL
jgi:hypothetical protein